MLAGQRRPIKTQKRNIWSEFVAWKKHDNSVNSTAINNWRIQNPAKPIEIKKRGQFPPNKELSLPQKLHLYTTVIGISFDSLTRN